MNKYGFNVSMFNDVDPVVYLSFYYDKVKYNGIGVISLIKTNDKKRVVIYRPVSMTERGPVRYAKINKAGKFSAVDLAGRRHVETWANIYLSMRVNGLK